MTTFLGASVTRFDVNLDFGGGQIALNVDLAECEGETFTPITIGHPVAFTYDNFSFYGILETYESNNSSGGFPVHSAQLTNADHVFNGVQVILNDYYGTTSSIPNLVNAFGYLENSGGFGGSEVNEAGISWAKVADSLDAICNNVTPGTYGGPISYKGKKYKLDLSELPNTVPSYYRINSDAISLNDFVSNVCEAGGHDFYVQLRSPTVPEATAGFSGAFVVKTIDRTTEPTSGLVAAFIEATGCVVSHDVGQETRRDTNGKFVVGDNVSQMWFVSPNGSGDNTFNFDDDDYITESEYGNDTILPYFGLNSDGDMRIGYTPRSDPSEYYFNIDIRDVDINFGTDGYVCTLGELAAAKKGRASWERFLAQRNANRYIIDNNGYTNVFFEVDYQVNSGLSPESPLDSGLYLIPKYGFCHLLVTQNNKAKALSEYINTKYSVPDGRFLYYPTSLQPNPYFLRLSKLRLNNAGTIHFARLFEGDLYDRAQSDPDLNKAYLNFKETLGLGDQVGYTANYMRATNARYGSSSEDLDNGNLIDKGLQLYRKIKDLADNYYNKRFAVMIPSVYAATEPETQLLRTSVEVDRDGYIEESAWPTAYSAGLIPSINGLNKILSPSNKFLPFVKYENAITLASDGTVAGINYDVSEISNGDKVFDTPEVSPSGDVSYDCWVKCSVDDQIVYQDNETQYGPRVIVEIPGSVKQGEGYPAHKKMLMQSLSQFAFSDGGTFYNEDASGKAEIQEKIIDKIGSDEFIFHQGEDLSYPTFAAVPLKSKINCYGPWSSAGADGPVSYERNNDLVPWNYGSYTALNLAGNARANNGVTNQTFGETGSMTLLGAPDLDLGGELVSGGPYITSINVDTGAQGTQTTYTYKTWTTFKSLSTPTNFSLERIKRLNETRRKIDSIYRDGFSKRKWANPGNFWNDMKGKFINLDDYGRENQSNTSSRVISSENNVTSSTVVIQPTYNMRSQIAKNYKNKSTMSLDGLFRPVSTTPHDNMSHFEVPASSIVRDHVMSMEWINPFSSGNDIEILTANSSLQDDTFTGDIEKYNNVSVYRGAGMRFPMVGVGYGYDHDGYPVPYESGFEDRSRLGGQVPYNDESFKDGYKSNPKLWKAGPVDMRWDHRRGIWGAPSLQMGITRSSLSVGNIYAPSVCKISRWFPDVVNSTGDFADTTWGYCFDETLGAVDTNTLVYYYNVYGINHIVYAACDQVPELTGIAPIAFAPTFSESLTASTYDSTISSVNVDTFSGYVTGMAKHSTADITFSDGVTEKVSTVSWNSNQFVIDLTDMDDGTVYTSVIEKKLDDTFIFGSGPDLNKVTSLSNISLTFLNTGEFANSETQSNLRYFANWTDPNYTGYIQTRDYSNTIVTNVTNTGEYIIDPSTLADGSGYSYLRMFDQYGNTYSGDILPFLKVTQINHQGVDVIFNTSPIISGQESENVDIVVSGLNTTDHYDSRLTIYDVSNTGIEFSLLIDEYNYLTMSASGLAEGTLSSYLWIEDNYDNTGEFPKSTIEYSGWGLGTEEVGL